MKRYVILEVREAQGTFQCAGCRTTGLGAMVRADMRHAMAHEPGAFELADDSEFEPGEEGRAEIGSAHRLPPGWLLDAECEIPYCSAECFELECRTLWGKRIGAREHSLLDSYFREVDA